MSILGIELSPNVVGLSILLTALALGNQEAFAQTTRHESQRLAAAQAGQTYKLNIPSKSLLAALADFTAATGTQVVRADAEALTGQSQPVSGTFSAVEALKLLLGDTGLTYRFTTASTVTLERVAPPAPKPARDLKQLTAPEPQPEPAITLPQVTVQDTRDKGYVATQSSVGTKTDTPLIETPQSIAVVTREEMDARNVQTDAEALLYTAGVWAQPFGGRQNLQNPFFYMRGFESAFGGSYVDGLVSPVNYRYEPYGLERVEILRGPTSALYGQSDPGGLINRESKRPTTEPLREIQFQGGNYNRLQGAVDLSGPIDSEGQFLYRLTTVYRNSDAAVKYHFDQTLPDDRAYVAPALTWRPSPNTSLTLLGSYLRDNAVQENSFLAPDFHLTHIRLSQRNFDDFNYHQYALGYLFEHRFSSAWTFTQKLRFADLKYDYLSLGQDTLLDDGHTVSRFADGFLQKRNDLTLDNQLQVKFATGPVDHRALFGLDYQNLKETVGFIFGEAPNLDTLNPDYHQQIETPEPYLKLASRSSTVGLYFQDQLKFYERWVLTVGGRYDWNRGQVEDKLFGGTIKTRLRQETANLLTGRALLISQILV
jgi:iron complex outermembrane recepter protein